MSMSVLVESAKLAITLKHAISEYRSLGEDEAARCVADSHRTAIAQVQRSFAALLHNLDLPKDAKEYPQKPFIDELIKNGRQVIDNSWQEREQSSKQALQAKLDEVSPWASGSTDGQSWYDTAETGASLEAVLQLGQETLTLRDPKEYDTTARQVEGLLDTYKEIHGAFSQVQPKGYCESVVTVIDLLRITHVEGLLVTLFSSGLTVKSELKKKAMAIKKKVPDALWSRVQAHLHKRAADAIVLR